MVWRGRRNDCPTLRFEALFTRGMVLSFVIAGSTHDVTSGFLRAFAYSRKAPITICHVCLSEYMCSDPNRRIFVKFYIRDFRENLSRKSTFSYNQTKTPGTLHEDQYGLTVAGDRRKSALFE
jgi:hypothetical protein